MMFNVGVGVVGVGVGVGVGGLVDQATAPFVCVHLPQPLSYSKLALKWLKQRLQNEARSSCSALSIMASDAPTLAPLPSSNDHTTGLRPNCVTVVTTKHVSSAIFVTVLPGFSTKPWRSVRTGS